MASRGARARAHFNTTGDGKEEKIKKVTAHLSYAPANGSAISIEIFLLMKNIFQDFFPIALAIL